MKTHYLLRFHLFCWQWITPWTWWKSELSYCQFEWKQFGPIEVIRYSGVKPTHSAMYPDPRLPFPHANCRCVFIDELLPE